MQDVLLEFLELHPEWRVEVTHERHCFGVWVYASHARDAINAHAWIGVGKHRFGESDLMAEALEKCRAWLERKLAGDE